jgi:hypothetical protein
MDALPAIQSALARLRATAESIMTDEFTVLRYTGSTVTDPETGVDSPEHVTVATTIGKVQSAGGIASQVISATGDAQNAGGNVPQWSLYLHFPVSLTGLQPGDVVECTRSNDPALTGRRFRLVNMQSEKTHATARRWNVNEIPEDGS